MSKETPYCEDCKYFQPDKSLFFVFSSARKNFAKCGRTASGVFRGERGKSYCSIQRERGECGPEGKYFEAKG